MLFETFENKVNKFSSIFFLKIIEMELSEIASARAL